MALYTPQKQNKTWSLAPKVDDNLSCPSNGFMIKTPYSLPRQPASEDIDVIPLSVYIFVV